MMKQEFEKRIGRGISIDDYERLEKVRKWFPFLSGGMIADIYGLNKAYAIRSLYWSACDIEKDTKHSHELSDIVNGQSETIACLFKENEELKTDNAKLIAENEILQNHSDSIKDQSGALAAKYDECMTELQQYKALIEDIKEYFRSHDDAQCIENIINNYGF